MELSTNLFKIVTPEHTFYIFNWNCTFDIGLLYSENLSQAAVHLNDWRRGFNTQGNNYTHGRYTSKWQYTHNIYNRLVRYQENEGIVLKLVPNVSSKLSKELLMMRRVLNKKIVRDCF
jgi:hypothetical protein